MSSIEKLEEELKLLAKEAKNLTEKKDKAKEEINQLLIQHDKIQSSIFEKSLSHIYVKEIYRVAQVQFSRLKKLPHNTPLSPEDIAELEKWISRAKSTDGLKDIKEALEEMNKYYPGEVSNIYGVIQKIIIGGANKSKRKPATKN